jgi:hypothetical protein
MRILVAAVVIIAPFIVSRKGFDSLIVAAGQSGATFAAVAYDAERPGPRIRSMASRRRELSTFNSKMVA